MKRALLLCRMFAAAPLAGERLTAVEAGGSEHGA
jgi:hypothetical protein